MNTHARECGAARQCHNPTRRAFLGALGVCAGAPMYGELFAAPAEPRPGPHFKISLAQWSLHRALKAGRLDPLDFPKTAKSDFGIDAVEYVNQFFMDKTGDEKWLGELNRRCDDLGVKSLLIMCDGVGRLGDPDAGKRTMAVDAHRHWIDAARSLGCHSIRVNADSQGTPDEQRNYVVDGLRRLAQHGETHEINVIVENHGGLSSNAAWLMGVLHEVDHPRCGTLPDFGNFLISRKSDGSEEWYDRYQGVREMMPLAKGVSAKAYDFDESGNERHTDYRKMMRIVLASGYRGHIGIEYEGNRLAEPEGIRLTRRLLEKVRDELAVDPAFTR